MSRLYNTDKVIRSIKPTLGLEKTKEFKKKLEDKKKPTGSGTKHYYVPKNFNKGGRVGLKGGSDLKAVIDKKTNKKIFVTKEELAKNTNKYNPPSMVEKRAKGGRVGLKGGNGFPDLSGDGKTTFKDILIGRGVIKKNKKKMVAKKSKTPMDKAVKKNKKNKRFV